VVVQILQLVTTIQQQLLMMGHVRLGRLTIFVLMQLQLQLAQLSLTTLLHVKMKALLEHVTLVVMLSRVQFGIHFL